MVGRDPGSEVCIQIFSAESRCVTVDAFSGVFGILQLFKQVFVSVQNSGQIHHLTKTEHARMLIIRSECRRRQSSAIFFACRGRNAAWQHKEAIDRQLFRAFQ